MKRRPLRPGLPMIGQRTLKPKRGIITTVDIGGRHPEVEIADRWDPERGAINPERFLAITCIIIAGSRGER
jgi:hypothetical protein